ncbi:MAG: ATP-binding protein [Candidatus Omnitrophica bacterium]|nr:ATP-binding protein [Candidatus Omnitrophota bacterium]
MHKSSARGSVFFGRADILRLLEKRLDAFQKGYRQNIGIVGPPFIGKSVLVKAFLGRLIQSDVIAISFSSQEFDSFERFSERWMAELTTSFYHAFGKPLPSSFQNLLRSLKESIPKTLQRMRLVKKLTFKRRYDQAYQELLGLTALLHQECGKKVLVVLDDFDRFSEMGLKNPFADLGKEIMVQKETMFIVTSSRAAYSSSVFREKLSLLFGNFEVIELGPFGFDEARDFMDQNFSGRVLEDDLKRFLIRLTDGHPYYLDLLAHRLRIASVESETTNHDLVCEALRQELYESNGMLYQHFRTCLHRLACQKPWPFYGDTLLAIALGHKRHSQMTKFLHQKGNDINRILERLLVFEVIEKHGSLFQIPDPLFRFWLSKVYYRERFSIDRMPVQGIQGFQGALEKAIAESTLEDQRELPKRIEELFLKFANDVVELNHRKFKCPQFSEVLSRPNNGRVFPVFAKNGKINWLCQVLSGPTKEEDIHLFLQDVKRLGVPIHKKLMIGLRGIELNAKLLAQEAKIQYLDLRNFNFLLDLYGKPKLVV